MKQRVAMIRGKLMAAFSPTELEIIDESHKHAGHEGARSGGGHYKAYIVSAAFEGKNPLERHRMVYEALGDMMKTDIHALSIKAFSPSEAENR